MAEMISYGGGVNSTAMIILLVNDGWRGPIVFSDTGCEWPDTYCFMDQFEAEWLEPRGLEITRIGIDSEHRLSSARVSLVEYCEHYNIFPTGGMRWCTVKWKVEPVNRMCGDAVQLLGIAADEAHRQNGRECPLVDRGVTRRGCIEIVQAEGLPVPRKSGCYMCWAQRIPQWRELHKLYPELYARVAKLERQVMNKKGIDFTLLRSGPLDVLRDNKLAGEIDMFDEDLREYQPCACGL